MQESNSQQRGCVFKCSKKTMSATVIAMATAVIIGYAIREAFAASESRNNEVAGLVKHLCESAFACAAASASYFLFWIFLACCKGKSKVIEDKSKTNNKANSNGGSNSSKAPQLKTDCSGKCNYAARLLIPMFMGIIVGLLFRVVDTLTDSEKPNFINASSSPSHFWVASGVTVGSAAVMDLCLECRCWPYWKRDQYVSLTNKTNEVGDSCGTELENIENSV